MNANVEDAYLSDLRHERHYSVTHGIRARFVSQEHAEDLVDLLEDLPKD